MAIFDIIFTGVKAGSTYAEVKAQAEGAEAVSQNVDITVTEKPATTLILSSNSVSVEEGSTASITAETNASSIDVTVNDTEIATASTQEQA